MSNFLKFLKFIKWVFSTPEKTLPYIKGYTDEQINEAMVHIVGEDWKTIQIAQWKERLSKHKELVIPPTTSVNGVIIIVINYYFWHNEQA